MIEKNSLIHKFFYIYHSKQAEHVSNTKMDITRKLEWKAHGKKKKLFTEIKSAHKFPSKSFQLFSSRFHQIPSEFKAAFP